MVRRIEIEIVQWAEDLVRRDEVTGLAIAHGWQRVRRANDKTLVLDDYQRVAEGRI